MALRYSDFKRLWTNTGKGPYRFVQICLSVSLAIVVAAAVIYYGNDLVAALRKVDIKWVFWGLLFYGVNYVLRGARFNILSRGVIRLWPQGLHAACFHGFATYMLPFRSGEMTLPVILRSMTDMTLTDGSRLLVRARLLDLQTLGIWIAFAALTADIHLQGTMRAAWLVFGALMMISPVVIRWMGAQGEHSDFKLFRWFGRFIDTEPNGYAGLVVSVGIWAAVAGCYFCAARSVGIPLSPMQAWLLITIQLPMQLIPVQGIANAGNHEGGWVAGLMLLGVPLEAAIELSLLSHAIILLCVLALGPAALLTGYFSSVGKCA